MAKADQQHPESAPLTDEMIYTQNASGIHREGSAHDKAFKASANARIKDLEGIAANAKSGHSFQHERAERALTEKSRLRDELDEAREQRDEARAELAEEREENLRLRKVIDGIGMWDNAAAGCSPTRVTDEYPDYFRKYFPNDETLHESEGA